LFINFAHGVARSKQGGVKVQRKFPWWSFAILILVLLGVVGYNIWAYNCGYCAIQDMKRIGPQVKAVSFLIIGAAITWFILYMKKRVSQTPDSCSCGRCAHSGWSYCPDCGDSLS